VIVNEIGWGDRIGRVMAIGRSELDTAMIIVQTIRDGGRAGVNVQR